MTGPNGLPGRWAAAVPAAGTLPDPALPGRVPARVRRAPRSWDPLLICLAVYLLTAVGRVHQIVAPLGIIKPLLLACAFAVVFYIADHTASRTLGPVLRASTTRWVLGFLFWAGISVITSLRPGEAVMTFLNSLPKTVAMYLLIVAAVRDWRDVERLCWTYFLAVAIYAAAVLLLFEVTTDKWRLEGLYYYDANDFATLAVTALPLGLYFAVTARSRWLRVVAIAGLASLIVSFVWTGSRGGMLALGAVVVYLLLRFQAIRPVYRLGVAGALVILLLGTASEAYWEKMATMFRPSADYNLVGPWGRMQIWERGVGYMIQFPFAGVGYNNFNVAEGTLFELAAEMQSHGKGAKWGVAHNSFIQAGAELGVPGLLMFVGMLASAALAASSVRAIPNGPREPPYLARSLVASLLGFTVGAFFLTLTYSDLMFALIALAAALAKTTRIARIPRLPERASWF